MKIFIVFLIAYLLSQFFRSFLAVIAPELAVDISLSPTELGNISAALFVAFAIAQFPVGWALDTIGPRRTVPAGMLVAVAGCLLFAAAGDALTALAAMALIGIGCGPIYMGALYYFGRTYHARHFALLSSWLLGIGSAGNLLAATPLAMASAALGWRMTFIIIAGVTLAAAVLVGALIPNVKTAAPVKAAGARESGGMVGDLLEVLKLRVIWPLLPIALISYAVAAVERGLWIGPFLTDVYGLSPMERGNAALVMAIAMSLGAIGYGPLDQWLGTRKWIVVAGSLLTAGGFAALALGGGQPLAMAIVWLTVIGAAGMTYGVLMAHARGFFPDHLLGRGITMMNFLLIGGAGLLQIISGRLVEYLRTAGWSSADVYACLHGAFALALLATTLIYLLSRDNK